MWSIDPRNSYLKFEKQALELKGDRFGLFLLRSIKAPAIQSIPKFRRHEQRLYQAVEIAGHGLVH